jgi:hypothetical protein
MKSEEGETDTPAADQVPTTADEPETTDGPQSEGA